MARIEELCDVVRTKNAGPYTFALDLVFHDPAVYRQVKSEELLGAADIAEVYGIPVSDVVNFEFFDDVLAVKAAIRRRVVAGSPGDSDCYAMNQEVPALRLTIPVADTR